MEDQDSTTKHWLTVHERVRKQIKRLITVLAIIAAVLVIHGTARLQHDNESYQAAREFTLQLQKEGPRKEAAQLFAYLCTENFWKQFYGRSMTQKVYREFPVKSIEEILQGPKDKGPYLFGKICSYGYYKAKLSDIPNVRWELERFVNKNNPHGLYDFAGYKLDISALFYLSYFGPLVILVFIYTRIRICARIATKLRERAVSGCKIQQCLNSLFSERATERLGEWRWLYASTWILIILFLALNPAVSLAVQSSYELNTIVSIDVDGNILPLPEAELNNRTIQKPYGNTSYPALFRFTVCVFCLGFLMWWSVVRQLRPT